MPRTKGPSEGKGPTVSEDEPGTSADPNLVELVSMFNKNILEFWEDKF